MKPRVQAKYELSPTPRVVAQTGEITDGDPVLSVNESVLFGTKTSGRGTAREVAREIDREVVPRACVRDCPCGGGDPIPLTDRNPSLVLTP